MRKLVLAILVSGCATIASDKYVDITLTSDYKRGMKYYVDGATSR